jgi:hypothetical protein
MQALVTTIDLVKLAPLSRACAHLIAAAGASVLDRRHSLDRAYLCLLRARHECERQLGPGGANLVQRRRDMRMHGGTLIALALLAACAPQPAAVQRRLPAGAAQTMLAPAVGTSALATAAAAMQPGTWVSFSTNGFDGGAAFRPPNGGSILEYQERANWNPIDNTVMELGASHPAAPTRCGGSLFVKYTDSTNTWSALPTPCPDYDDASPLGVIDVGHGYDHQAIDSDGNIYHRQYGSGKVMVFSHASQAWSQCAPWTASSHQVAGALVYSPARNSLYFLDGDWGLWELSLASGNCDGSWTELASTKGGGFSPQLTGLSSYHNVGDYSASCQCVVIGGDGTRFYKITSSNVISETSTAPAAIGIPQATGGAILTHDPLTGHFLAWTGSGTGRVYDASNDSWSTTGIGAPIFPGPEGGVTETIAIPIATYGVIMFVQVGSTSGGSVYLYKHNGT